MRPNACPKKMGSLGDEMVAILHHNQMDLLSIRAAAASLDALDYRMLGDRKLADGWKARARDNVKAIELAQRIEQESRPATETEQGLLMKFVGFGASDLANGLFEKEPRKGWEDIGKALTKAVSEAEMAELARCTQYAHYTPEYMVKAIWRGLKRMGFTGGKILEPALGTGLFWALMPEGIASRSTRLGYESDPTTARIARLLYPESDVVRMDFTKARIAYGFDLAIGNPPFARDQFIKNDLSETGKLGLTIHDYFIARSIERLRAGGLAAFVTSRYTMDKKDDTARRHIARLANLVGAIRMPETAMRKDAGTDVCVDILFFQKRPDDDIGDHEPSWIGLGQSGVVIEGKPVWINQHFVDNPASVLGVHDQRTSQWGPIYTCRPNSGQLSDLLINAVNDLPKGIYEATSVEADDAPVVVVPSVRVGTAAEGARIKEGSFFLDTSARDARRAALYDKADRVSDKAERKVILKEAANVGKELGILYQIVDSTPTEVAVKSGRKTPGIFGKSARVIRDMIPIREAVRDLLRAQENDSSWEDAQRRLNEAYDAFVERHGPINDASITEVPDKASKPLSDALAAFRKDEYELTGGAEYETLRGEIRFAYDSLKADFENAWGSIDTAEDRIIKKETVRYPNISAFRDDPDAYLVAAVEIYDQQTGEATKGPIFTQRVISAPRPISIESPADALAVVLNECGKVDMVRISELLRCSEVEAIANLRDLVYFDPEARGWQTSDEYLSGLVRDKLEKAREVSVSDPKLERNVVALEAVQPVDLMPSEITAKLGAPWIPPSDIEAFSLEVLKVRTTVYHTASVGVWSVDVKKFAGHASATVDWGTKRRHAGLILLDALQNSTPVIMDDIEFPDGSTKRVQNAKETQAAQDKFAQMKQAFVDWVWTKPERADRLSREYNQKYNNLVPRKFDGSHLVLPGASSVIELREHQKSAVWGMMCGKVRYLAHAVGAGKTFTDIAAIMEQRRLGMLNKAMVVVPGHTLAQWAREWLLLYPNAKILVADEENFSKNKRDRFVSRASLGDWDAIIITHSAFECIAAPFEFEQKLINDQLEILEEVQETLDKDDRLGVKKLNGLKEKLKRKLEGLQSKKDDCVNLEEMHVDQISVDEAQEFRKLSFITNLSQLKGVDPKGSDMSWDLFVKGRFLQQTNPDRALTMLSGTPITNTMGEMFSLLVYLHINGLAARNVEHFDAWIATFGESKTELELQPSGNYKAVTRLSEFVNIPELSAMFLDVASVVLSDDLANFVKLPRLRVNQSGKREREVLTYEGGPTFRHYQKVLGQRIKAIEERGGRPEKGADIILTVIGDGRHAAIDMRLVDPVRDLAVATEGRSEKMRGNGDRHELDTAELRLSHVNNPANKLNGLIDNAFRIWQETADKRYVNPATGEEYALPGASQMIFSDIGTEAAEAKRGFSVYTWMRNRLISLGVPQDQIAIMQHFKKMLAKQRLFNDVNSGRVRFLLGSSQTMGTGVNAHQRLIALHHLDAPYLPSLIGQREGRIIRQGNQNEEVGVYVYATLASMDATMWQILERKQRFIDAVLRGDKTIRRLADLEASEGDQFAMAKALASGDTRLMQKAGLEQDIARLIRRRSAFHDSQSNVLREIRYAGERIVKSNERLELLLKDLKTREIPMPDAFKMTVEGVEFTSMKEAGVALMTAINTVLVLNEDKSWCLAEYAGFRLEAETWISTNHSTGNKERVCFAWLITDAARYRVFEMDLRTGEAIIARMEATLNDLEHKAIDAQSAIASSQDTIADYTKRLGGSFDLQAELDEKLALLAEVDASLAPKKEEVKEPERVAA